MVHFCPTGMAGNNELDNAVLGGIADYITDIIETVSKVFHAKEEDKVNACLLLQTWLRFVSNTYLLTINSKEM